MIHIYNNTNELVKVLAKPALSSWENSQSSRLNTRKINDWAGGTYEEAERLLQVGDIVNAAKIKSEQMKLEAIRGTRTAIKSAVVGCVPNVPAYIIGAPNNMFAVRKELAPVKIIRLYVDVSVGHTVTAADKITIGAKVASAISVLEKNKYRVELYCGALGVNFSAKEIFGFFLKLKKATAPINYASLAFSTIHPAFLRRIDFAHTERTVEHAIGAGYGYPTNTNTDPKFIYPADVKRGALLHLSDIRGYHNVQDIVGMILEQVK